MREERPLRVRGILVQAVAGLLVSACGASSVHCLDGSEVPIAAFCPTTLPADAPEAYAIKFCQKDYYWQASPDDPSKGRCYGECFAPAVYKSNQNPGGICQTCEEHREEDPTLPPCDPQPGKVARAPAAPFHLTYDLLSAVDLDGAWSRGPLAISSYSWRIVPPLAGCPDVPTGKASRMTCTPTLTEDSLGHQVILTVKDREEKTSSSTTLIDLKNPAVISFVKPAFDPPVVYRNSPGDDVLEVSGADSVFADGTPATGFAWTVEDGQGAVVASSDESTLTWTVAPTQAKGEYAVHLVVTDGERVSPAATRHFTIDDSAVMEWDPSGLWTFKLEVTKATGVCSGDVGDTDSYAITISKTGGNHITAQGFNHLNSNQLTGTFNATLRTLVLSGSYPEGIGTTTTTYTLSASDDGDTLNGNEAWNWQGLGNSCPGSASTVEATR